MGGVRSFDIEEDEDEDEDEEVQVLIQEDPKMWPQGRRTGCSAWGCGENFSRHIEHSRFSRERCLSLIFGRVARKRWVDGGMAASIVVSV